MYLALSFTVIKDSSIHLMNTKQFVNQMELLFQWPEKVPQQMIHRSKVGTLSLKRKLCIIMISHLQKYIQSLLRNGQNFIIQRELKERSLSKKQITNKDKLYLYKYYYYIVKIKGLNELTTFALDFFESQFFFDVSYLGFTSLSSSNFIFFHHTTYTMLNY